MGTATAVRMTATEFAALPEDEEKRELIDGEVCVMASGGPVHERVKGNVLRKLAAFVEIHQLSACLQSETRYYQSNEVDIFQPDASAWRIARPKGRRQNYFGA